MVHVIAWFKYVQIRWLTRRQYLRTRSCIDYWSTERCTSACTARHYGRGPLRGLVDRVCIGVGGPIDFLAHVKAAREKPPLFSSHPQSPTISLLFLGYLRKLFSFPCRFRTPSSSLVFDPMYVIRAMYQVVIEFIILSTRVIRGDIYIVHHLVVFPTLHAKKSF